MGGTLTTIRAHSARGLHSTKGERMTSNSPLLSGVGDIVDRTWKSLLAVGIVSIIMGLIVLFWPGPTLVVVAVLFAIYLIISGIFLVVATFGAPDHSGWWRLLSFVAGVLSIILGVIAIRNPVESIILLAIWIGVAWIFRGVANLSLYSSTTELPGRGIGIFLAIITLLAGIILIVWPASSIGTLVWVSGILLIVVGIFEVVDAFSLKSSANQVQDAVTGR